MESKKKTAAGIILLGLLSMVPCYGNPAEEIKIKIGEKKTLGDLTIEPTGIIEDSRCPKGAKCIWAGTLKARFTLEAKGTVEVKEIEMLGPKDTSSKMLSFMRYKIYLVDAQPVPTTKRKLKSRDYEFRVRVLTSPHAN